MISHSRSLVVRGAVLLIGALAVAHGQSGPALRLEKTVLLPGVAGRIDHLAVDVGNQRLFVAALGNNTVEVIDIRGARRLHSIRGQQKPQGVLYLPEQNRLFVANGNDGTCRIFDASTFRSVRVVPCGDDADNLRVDPSARRVYVGYGEGALGVMDFDGNKLADMPLGAHPESFQLEKSGARIFVNLPDSRKVAVVDRRTSAVTANWSTGDALSNFPMALDEANKRVFIVCRRPATLLVLDTDSGAVISKLPTVGDSDDIFWDQRRQRLYVTGGEGAIAVYQQDDPNRYREIARTKTVKGARTSLFVPDLSLLFLAVPRQGADPAAIQVYRVLP